MNTNEKEPSSTYLSPDLSSDEVRKARGLEPEQPKPVTPESLAREYITTTPNDWAVSCAIVKQREFDAHRSGFRANAERNADIAQRLDLAEEALKRNGFERGVMNDVVTWVPKGDEVEYIRIFFRRELGRLHDENAALKTAVSDYAKAAEASATLVEKLTRERDSLRDTPSPVITALEEERDTLRVELSAANEARKKEKRNHKALSQYLRAGSLDVDAYLGVYDERDSLKAALEKERAEVAQLKQHLSNQCDCANRWEDAAEQAEKKCDDLRQQLDDTLRKLAEMDTLRMEWQAAAGKKDAALKEIANMPKYDQDDEHRLRRKAQDALSTPPTTALIDALEWAFREAVRNVSDSLIVCRHGDEYAKELWLSSETRKRYSGGTEAGA